MPDPKSTLTDAQALGLATPQPDDMIHRGDDAITLNARHTADALNAAADAQGTAATAVGIAEDKADPEDALLPSGDPVAVLAIVDEDHRRTWLEVAPDGGPTVHSGDKITAAVSGPIGETLGLADMPSEITGLSLAIVDEDGRRTWLEADEDGRPSPRAVELLRAGLEGTTTTAGTYVDPQGATRPITSGPDVVLNGDSLTAQGSWHTELATLTGLTVRKNAVGGESSSGIAARQGATPLLLAPEGGAIPATGSVNIVQPITTSNGHGVWPMLQGPNPMTGTLAGVHGSFRLTKAVAGSYTHNDGDVYTFTRTTDGDAVAVDRPVPFTYDLGESTRGDVQVFWAGRNNTTESDRILAELDAMVQHMTGLEKRFLVVGITNGAGEGTGTAAYDRITAHNARLEKYGRHYLRLREYLVQYGLRDAGITPTTQDEADIAADLIPDSLRTDSLHFEPVAQTLIAQQIAARLTELGWK